MIGVLRWLQFPVHEWDTSVERSPATGYWARRKCIHCQREDTKPLGLPGWIHLRGPMTCTVQESRPRRRPATEIPAAGVNGRSST